MKLYEFDNRNPLEGGYYDPNEDVLNQKDISQSRSDRLFLKHLNRLKKMRALKKLENLKRQDLLGVMYGDEGGGDEGGMMGAPPGF